MDRLGETKKKVYCKYCKVEVELSHFIDINEVKVCPKRIEIELESMEEKEFWRGKMGCYDKES